jgi:mycothiol synthase
MHLKKSIELLFGSETIYLILRDLGNLPPVILDKAYTFKTIAEGNEMDYIHVIRNTFYKNADINWFRESFLEDANYDPENQIIIWKGKEPIAVATAWQVNFNDKPVGMIHMLGVSESYQGQGIGRQIALITLYRLKERGFKEAIVGTQDYRIPAICLYHSLGFRPLFLHWTHKKRWKRISAEININNQ